MSLRTTVQFRSLSLLKENLKSFQNLTPYEDVGQDREITNVY